MKQINIGKSDEFQPAPSQSFFDTGAVKMAHPVVPLRQIAPDITGKRFRVPFKAANGRFTYSLAFLILLPALIIFAGIAALLYNSQARNISNAAPKINETVIPAEQINIDPLPQAKSVSVVSKTTQQQKKVSDNELSNSELNNELNVENAPVPENLPKENKENADTEDSKNKKAATSIPVIPEELKRDADSDKSKQNEDEDGPELKRQRKDDDKQNKSDRSDRKDKRDKPKTDNSEQVFDN